MKPGLISRDSYKNFNCPSSAAREREQRQLPNFNMVIKDSLKLMKPLISKTEAGMVTNHGFILT